MALNEDNLKFEIGDVDKKTVTVWNKLKNIDNISPKIKHSNIVYIGLRDTEKEEDYLIKKYKIKVFKSSKVRRDGAKKIINEIIYIYHLMLTVLIQKKLALELEHQLKMAYLLMNVKVY